MATNNSLNLKAQGTAYYNGTGTFSGVDASTAGFALTSNGTGVAPSFQAQGGSSGSVIFISSQTPSGAASAAFTTGIDNTYDTYLFIWKNVSAASNGVSFIAEVSTDGGSNWLATGYASTYFRFNSGGTGANSITTAVLLSESSGFSSTNASAGRVIFHYIRSAGTGQVDGTGTYPVSAGGGSNGGGAVTASLPASSTINAIRFRMSSGNLSGFFAMYGIEES